MEFGAKLGISVMDGWTRLNCCSFDAYNEAGKSSGDGRTVTHTKCKGGHHLLRIMIVEDEPPINRLLQALIEACGSEYRIVASAYNGQEALDMIEEVQPDVVFTDVKMPCMDGLELTKQLHTRCAGTLVVVISGYGDYQTVRAMLQQDVFDYLLKPVQPNVLNNLLQQIEKAVLDRQQQHMTQVFLQAMKNGTLRHCLFPATHHMCFIAGIGCIGSYPSCLPHNYSLDTHAWPTILNQFDGFNAWQVPGATNAEQIFILSFPHYNREKIEHSCLQFSNAFALPRPSTFLFGKPTASIEDAGMSVQLLRNALPLYVRIGESQTITFCDIQTDPCVPDFFLNKEDQSLIQLYCIQGDFASFSQLIRNLFNVFRTNRLSQYSVMRILKWIVQCLEEHINEKTCFDRYYADLLVDEAILCAFDYPSLLSSYLCICEDIFKIVSRSKKQSSGLRDLVGEIADYLEQNFNQPITSSDLEEHFLFSSSYITQVFKKQNGVSPNKYLLQYRAKKACELIVQNPNITVKALADVLGFSDPLYLYKFFKNEVGCSLSEYKEKVRCDKAET